MKKYFDKVAVMFCLGVFVGEATGSESLVINRDVTGDGKPDRVMLTDNNSEFYTFSIVSNGKQILHNEGLVPKGIINKGGLEVFQGLSVVDYSISIGYRFCSPSSAICYDRNIIGIFKGGRFVVLKERVVTAIDNIALTEDFYQESDVLLGDLTYQSLLETNRNARSLFSSTYGSCLAVEGGDALIKISEALEKQSAEEWVMRKGCITPALVFALQAQKYLSYEAALRYLTASERGSGKISFSSRK